MITEPTLDLRDAAEALGVHYQTAYRWVRNGRLSAQLVDGRYVVTQRAMAEMEERRRTPSAPRSPSPKRLARQAERMSQALLDGDEADAREIARRLVGEGTSIAELIQTVLAPPLRAIGQAWHDGELTIWVEHRASAIVERILGELAPNPRGRRRGTAVVAAVSGDLHSLPTTMAAVALREANWHIHHLGADMPGDELVRFCDEHEVDVVVLSSTNPDCADDAAATARALEAAGTPAIVGGPGRSLEALLDAAQAAKASGSGRA